MMDVRLMDGEDAVYTEPLASVATGDKAQPVRSHQSPIPHRTTPPSLAPLSALKCAKRSVLGGWSV